LLDQDAPLRDHRPPFRRRGPDAKPKERQTGKRDDGVSDIEREERDEGAERVRQDMAQENPPGPIAERTRSLDVLLRALDQDQAAG